MGLLSLDLEMMTTGIDYKDGDDSYASSSNEEDYAFYYNTPRQYVIIDKVLLNMIMIMLRKGQAQNNPSRILIKNCQP